MKYHACESSVVPWLLHCKEQGHVVFFLALQVVDSWRTSLSNIMIRVMGYMICAYTMRRISIRSGQKKISPDKEVL